MTMIGRCHCGRNAFEIDGELPKELTRCTCSLCSKRGHLYAYYKPEQFKATVADSDAIYRWNSKTVANHFCSASVAISTPTARTFSRTDRGMARRGASR